MMISWKPKARRLAAAVAAPAAWAMLACLGLASCAHNPPRAGGEPSVSRSPGVPWQPPREALEPATQAGRAVRPAAVPADLAAAADSLTLAAVVDIALRNSTETRTAWASARSAAASYGSRRGSYWPSVGIGADYSRRQTSSAGTLDFGRPGILQPAVDLEFLLFDFGGREADVSVSRHALYAASFLHNAAIQDVALSVQEAYYQYLAVRALAGSQRSTVREAQANLDAAEQRHRAGLATIADVLQARTAFSQAQLTLQTLEGQIATTRGALATAMGLPANAEFEVALADTNPPVEETTRAVDDYLEAAQKARPDLAAARAQARQAHALVSATRAEGYPAITTGLSYGRLYYEDGGSTDEAYAAAVRFRVPIFTGFSHTYDVQRAKADEDAARSRLASAEQRVVLDVWTSYYGLKTAEQRLLTSRDLLASATESHDVALGRYRAGVGSILDLLAAQSALEDARAQNVQARSDWYVSVARLAHATGTLNLPGREGTR